jgi:hypothetical protein
MQINGQRLAKHNCDNIGNAAAIRRLRDRVALGW